MIWLVAISTYDSSFTSTSRPISILDLSFELSYELLLSYLLFLFLLLLLSSVICFSNFLIHLSMESHIPSMEFSTVSMNCSSLKVTVSCFCLSVICIKGTTGPVFVSVGAGAGAGCALTPPKAQAFLMFSIASLIVVVPLRYK